MALLFTGTKTRSCGIVQSIIRFSKLVNLKPAKTITIKFDPFHESSVSLRQFSYFINKEDILLTNPRCRVRTEVISSQSEDPRVEVNLENGESILIKCHHLNAVEIFQLMVNHVSSLVPQPVSTKTVTTKGKKK